MHHEDFKPTEDVLSKGSLESLYKKTTKVDRDYHVEFLECESTHSTNTNFTTKRSHHILNIHSTPNYRYRVVSQSTVPLQTSLYQQQYIHTHLYSDVVAPL